VNTPNFTLSASKSCIIFYSGGKSQPEAKNTRATPEYTNKIIAFLSLPLFRSISPNTTQLWELDICFCVGDCIFHPKKSWMSFF
jgi:hypothetical protein